ncbi:hypothetical protein MWU60_18330 [Yoonia sp. F2084L]|uniref:hypothetical protein n=1 Tax=Yoonia sp. F2084L TaxID=2926419 RepID=UPI001FF121FF|nr:hypothetical protein [Yoonia sp. F2084L]MCK0097540.1 hypothetical protein [Yoonia sp. F2084L]
MEILTEAYRKLVNDASEVADATERSKLFKAISSELQQQIKLNPSAEKDYQDLFLLSLDKLVEADAQIEQEFIQRQVGEASDPIQSYRNLIERASQIKVRTKRSARLNELLWPAKRLDESLFSLCFDKIHEGSRSMKADWFALRPDLQTTEYRKKTIAQKAALFGDAVHRSMRSQAESGYDELAYFSEDWIKSMQHHEPDFLQIMERIYANWAGQWDVQAIRQRISSAMRDT